MYEESLELTGKRRVEWIQRRIHDKPYNYHPVSDKPTLKWLVHSI
jgi:hypothetical protein